MSTSDRENTESKSPSNAPPTDTSGKTVNVVERDLDDAGSDAEGVDKAITPSSIRVKEQEAEELKRRLAEIERKVDR